MPSLMGGPEQNCDAFPARKPCLSATGSEIAGVKLNHRLDRLARLASNTDYATRYLSRSDRATLLNRLPDSSRYWVLLKQGSGDWCRPTRKTSEAHAQAESRRARLP